MQTYAVYFRPRHSLASQIGSDTLFGAVCWGIRELGLKKDLAEWLRTQEGRPPFSFGTPTPYCFDSQKQPLLRFYPIPISFQTHTSNKDEGQQLSKLEQIGLVEIAKKTKNAKFASEFLFAEMADSTLSTETLIRELKNNSKTYHILGQILFSDQECNILLKHGIKLRRPLIQESPVQHNAIDRVSGGTGEGLLYYKNETHFAFQTGLWTLLRATETDLDQLILPALRYLEDTGIGADRTAGKGHFWIQVDSAPQLPVVDNPNAVMMLSRYLPAQQDGLALEGKPLAFKLITLRSKREQKFPKQTPGQATPPVYKQAIRVFEPGSVFPLREKQPLYGRMSQIVPTDQGGSVFLNGAGLPVFLKIREVGNE